MNTWPKSWWCVNTYPLDIYVVTVRRGDVHSVVIRWNYMDHALKKKCQLHVNEPVLGERNSWNKIKNVFVDYVNGKMIPPRSKIHNNV